MTLTQHLKDAASPVRQYLEGISPYLADLRGRSSAASATAGALGLARIAASPAIVQAPPNADASRTGTAFDIRARIALGCFDVASSAAAAGVAGLQSAVSRVENGCHRARVLEEAFVKAVALMYEPSNAADLDLAAVLFAHCEQVYRAGDDALIGAVGRACDQAADGEEFASMIEPVALADIRALMEANADQMGIWRELTDDGERFVANPSFSGAALVGGADGDWLVGDTLVDCKVYGKLTVSRLRAFLLQLLGYVMLDLDDALKIRAVGIWLPRQGLMESWSLAQLLDRDPEEVLPTLREGFAGTAGGNQIAVHEPPSQRPALQLLADNRHTPYQVLAELGDC